MSPMGDRRRTAGGGPQRSRSGMRRARLATAPHFGGLAQEAADQRRQAEEEWKESAPRPSRRLPAYSNRRGGPLHRRIAWLFSPDRDENPQLSPREFYFRVRFWSDLLDIFR